MPTAVGWRLMGCTLKDRLRFHYIVVKSAHTLKPKTFVRFFYFSLQAEKPSWLLVWAVRLQKNSTRLKWAHPAFQQDLLAPPCSSLQASDIQHTETGLPVQVEKASVWVDLLTGMLCKSLGPNLAHTQVHSQHNLCAWWKRLPFISHFWRLLTRVNAVKKRQGAAFMVLYYLCWVCLEAAPGVSLCLRWAKKV